MWQPPLLISDYRSLIKSVLAALPLFLSHVSVSHFRTVPATRRGARIALGRARLDRAACAGIVRHGLGGRACAAGQDILDNQALDMLDLRKDSVPVPARLRGREFNIDIPVIFNLDNPSS